MKPVISRSREKQKYTRLFDPFVKMDKPSRVPRDVSPCGSFLGIMLILFVWDYPEHNFFAVCPARDVWEARKLISIATRDKRLHRLSQDLSPKIVSWPEAMVLRTENWQKAQRAATIASNPEEGWK